MRRRKAAAAAATAAADAQIAARTASYNPTFGAGVTATGESQPCPACWAANQFVQHSRMLMLQPHNHPHECTNPNCPWRLLCCPPPACLPAPAVSTNRSPTKKGLMEPEVNDSPLRWVGAWVDRPRCMLCIVAVAVWVGGQGGCFVLRPSGNHRVACRSACGAGGVASWESNWGLDQ